MRLFLLIIFTTVAIFLRAESSGKPNIVLLYADDAGYADFGFNDSPHFETPHLDQLANGGTQFAQFYMSASVCGPSRAGLLTGKYQQRFGFEENNVPGIMSHAGAIGEDMGLPLSELTMGNHLQRLGYVTGIFGKWHMGIADRFHPTNRGFDEFLWFPGGARSYFAYTETQKQETTRGHWMEDGFGSFEEHQAYLTNALADRTCEFIRRNSDRPFFAFVSFNAVHNPMDTDPKDSDAFPSLEGKRRMLAQMTLSMDRACGKIINELKRLGLYEDTLIVFTNDNGGPTFANLSSNYAGVGDGANLNERGNFNNPNGNTRVRGRNRADNTVNFFLTDVPWDSDNVDRVNMQRGPNSMLFGLGSPAGIINANTQDAQFSVLNRVEFRIGSFGSMWGTLNFNRNVIDDVLAIWVLSPDGQVQNQKPTHEKRFPTMDW